MRARMAANDSSAAAGERTIVTGEIGYFSAYPTVGYGTLQQLGGPLPCVPAIATACLIDDNHANNDPAATANLATTLLRPRGGAAATGWNFYTTSAPVANTTGTRVYCAVDDGVVRTNNPPRSARLRPATRLARLTRS
jgi:hypothetical protein